MQVDFIECGMLLPSHDQPSNDDDGGGGGAIDEYVGANVALAHC